MHRICLILLALLALASPALAQTKITPEQCQKLNAGIASYGYEIVRIGASVEGFTEAQLRWAMNACRIKPPK